MVDHDPWVGPDYGKAGTALGGHRVAVVGYTHWGKGAEDRATVTIECISKLISGDLKMPSLARIRNCFGYNNNKGFWEQVMFFNYLPNSVEAEEWLGKGTEEQIMVAKPRFLHLIKKHRPSKVLIFTPKARTSDFPRPGSKLQSLQPFPTLQWGTYSVGHHSASAFFLRRPRPSDVEWLRPVVRYILDLPKVNIDPI
jgi:hypothetical protein